MKILVAPHGSIKIRKPFKNNDECKSKYFVGNLFGRALRCTFFIS